MQTDRTEPLLNEDSTVWVVTESGCVDADDAAQADVVGRDGHFADSTGLGHAQGSVVSGGDTACVADDAIASPATFSVNAADSGSGGSPGNRPDALRGGSETDTSFALNNRNGVDSVEIRQTDADPSRMEVSSTAGVSSQRGIERGSEVFCDAIAGCGGTGPEPSLWCATGGVAATGGRRARSVQASLTENRGPWTTPLVTWSRLAMVSNASVSWSMRDAFSRRSCPSWLAVSSWAFLD